MKAFVGLLLVCWSMFASALLPRSHPPAAMASMSTLKPLTAPTVEQAIDDALSTDKELPNMLETNKNLSISRIEDWKSTLEAMGEDATSLLRTKTPWYFGMSLRDTNAEKVAGIFSFYVAYSSWNGRILYVDRMDCDDNTEEVLLRILAKIAIDLDCARITWRHKDTPAWHSGGGNQPEIHGEVLTLSMDEDAMIKFLSDSSLSSVTSLDGEFGKELVEKAFSTCLEKINTGPFKLRLAKAADLQTMTGLVQGLADYCEESDAVHMEASDYVQDGFSLDDPLWYCLLVDKDVGGGKTCTCGYAFVFVGYILGEGRFIYLEDLYLEVEHRGGGGGSTVMKALAGLCRAMKCPRLYWQALDWNEAGLSFYSKIGAEIHPGEKTSRYATAALKQFADRGS